MQHKIILGVAKLNEKRMPVDALPFQSNFDRKKCRTHKQVQHDFFISYRVHVEGVKSPFSTLVCVNHQLLNAKILSNLP